MNYFIDSGDYFYLVTGILCLVASFIKFKYAWLRPVRYLRQLTIIRAVIFLLFSISFLVDLFYDWYSFPTSRMVNLTLMGLLACDLILHDSHVYQRGNNDSR